MRRARELTPPNSDFAAVTKKFLLAMPISQHFGFDVTDIGPGRFEITQPYRRDLSYQEGTFQAGSVGTLADMAAACASATMLPPGWTASTADYTVKLLEPAIGEKLVARGRILRGGRTLSVAAADVYAVRGSDEVLCATALVTVRNLAPAPEAGRQARAEGETASPGVC
jgi:uncharacterized protein (TIGR00369 family)